LTGLTVIKKFTVAKIPHSGIIHPYKQTKGEKHGKKQKASNLGCSASQAPEGEAYSRSALESTPRVASNPLGCWNTLVLGCQSGKYWL
jgi:hypothetical protein